MFLLRTTLKITAGLGVGMLSVSCWCVWWCVVGVLCVLVCVFVCVLVVCVCVAVCWTCVCVVCSDGVCDGVCDGACVVCLNVHTHTHHIRTTHTPTTQIQTTHSRMCRRRQRQHTVPTIYLHESCPSALSKPPSWATSSIISFQRHCLLPKRILVRLSTRIQQTHHPHMTTHST